MATTRQADAVPADRADGDGVSSVPDLADDIADMLRHGRRWGPKRIRRMIFIDEDGERSSIALPMPDAGEGGEPKLKELERDILRVLRQSGRRMKAVDIAGLIDPDQDPYDGSFGRAIKRLKGMGLIDGGKPEGGYVLAGK